jgi:hypothetical protein
MGRHLYFRTPLDAVKPHRAAAPHADRSARGNPTGGSEYQLMLDALAASAPPTVDEPPGLPASIARLIAVRRAWRAARDLPSGLRGPEKTRESE